METLGADAAPPLSCAEPSADLPGERLPVAMNRSAGALQKSNGPANAGIAGVNLS